MILYEASKMLGPVFFPSKHTRQQACTVSPSKPRHGPCNLQAYPLGSVEANKRPELCLYVTSRRQNPSAAWSPAGRQNCLQNCFSLGLHSCRVAWSTPLKTMRGQVESLRLPQQRGALQAAKLQLAPRSSPLETPSAAWSRQSRGSAASGRQPMGQGAGPG